MRILFPPNNNYDNYTFIYNVHLQYIIYIDIYELHNPPHLPTLILLKFPEPRNNGAPTSNPKAWELPLHARPTVKHRPVTRLGDTWGGWILRDLTENFRKPRIVNLCDTTVAWFRNSANQLRLVVYPIIYRVLYIPRWVWHDFFHQYVILVVMVEWG